MKRTLTILLASTLSAALLAPAALGADPVSYEGRLEGTDKQGLAGIFPLTFSLYRTSKSVKPVWTETHYVAADDGAYSVELGNVRPIPKSVSIDRVYLGVSLTGGEELVRARLRTPSDARRKEAVAPAVTPAPGKTPPAAGAKAGVSYAEEAGFAYEADRAKSADTIGGVTAKDLAGLMKNSSSKVTIGGSKHFTDSAGGSGGQPFTLRCPKGHVVTGIQGGAAALVDSIKLICSPIK